MQESKNIVCNKKMLIETMSVLIIMTVLVVATIISSYPLSGLGTIAIVIYFLVEGKIRNRRSTEIGFNFKKISKDIKKYWLIISLPIIANILCITIARLLIPEFYAHVFERVAPMLAVDKVVILIPQLLILAFIEEIAFRAFFQERLSWFIKPHLSIGATSVIFALAHFTRGSGIIVGYDLFFILINSVIYGYIFYKTKNVYASTFAHFIANVLGAYILLVL